jgi:LAS superfamily LD-carboxypeptidase LdcB
MKKKQARRRGKQLKVAMVAFVVIAMLFVGCMLWLLISPPAKPDDDTSVSTPSTTSSTATTTTTTTTTATSATTSATTKSDVVLQNGELLQYDTTGRYVQGGTSDWRLLLVNDWNPIDENYENAITLVAGGNRNQRVDSRILEPLNEMLAAGKAYGIDVQSGYRPYSHQSSLYWRQVNNYKNRGYNDTAAQEAAGKVVKRPGYSEHNCGLAVDLGGSGNFSLDASFENTPAYKWLMEHCAEYGFILRFPKGKESITGVIYEAWHFRYVGDAATAHAIMDNGLCLEEYLQQNHK